MQIKVEMNEIEIKRAIVEALKYNIGRDIDPAKVVVWVKSKRNFKAEWEQAEIKVEFNASVPDKNEHGEF